MVRGHSKWRISRGRDSVKEQDNLVWMARGGATVEAPLYHVRLHPSGSPTPQLSLGTGPRTASAPPRWEKGCIVCAPGLRHKALPGVGPTGKPQHPQGPLGNSGAAGPVCIES